MMGLGVLQVRGINTSLLFLVLIDMSFNLPLRAVWAAGGQWPTS